ncbi:MAG: hypothetical protein J2P28_11385 [Actinobacteria bacterium]|nr:hypothetical protein [Actinomycetota bacterium]
MTEIMYAGPVRRLDKRIPPPEVEAWRPAGMPAPDGEVGIAWQPAYVNYDPPEEAEGTGLIQAQADNAVIVAPKSATIPANPVDKLAASLLAGHVPAPAWWPPEHWHADGDEGPINEAYLTSPVVRLTAGQAYQLQAPVFVPEHGRLYLNGAIIDRQLIHLGHGALIVDDIQAAEELAERVRQLEERTETLAQQLADLTERVEELEENSASANPGTAQ